MPSWVKSLITAIVLIAVLYVVNAMMSTGGFFGTGIDDYQARLLVFIAINIILATSLNLVNGFTGQFSIGHAGFMSVGGYTAAFITTTLQTTHPALFTDAGGPASTLIFLAALLAGGVVAGAVGYIVGLPSLRLK